MLNQSNVDEDRHTKDVGTSERAKVFLPLVLL